MVSFFAAYDVLSRSGLFDSDFYSQAYAQDIASSGLDALSHYIELGAGQGRNPSPAFDTEFYIEQCAALGLTPDIPLQHYIEQGAAMGLRVQRPASPVDRITLDQMALVQREDGGYGLRGAGWLIGSSFVQSIAIVYGDEPLGFVAYGMDRPDIREAYPDHAADKEPGFTFHIKRLPEGLNGTPELEFVALLGTGEFLRRPFQVTLPDQAEAGPRKWQRGGLDSLGMPAMRLQIDECEVDHHGILTIGGWAVCLVPIATVEVFADDARLGAAEFGLQREDVAETHPEYHNAAFSGVRFAIDSRLVGDGQRTIRIRCTAKGGLRREVVIPMQITPALSSHIGNYAQVRLECDDFGVTEDGKVKAQGWAFCAAGIDTLSILLDDLQIGKARLGIERPDVGNLFPESAEARFSGFHYEAQISGMRIEGEHVICLRVVTKDGETGDMRLPVMATPAETQIAAPVESEGGIQVALDSPAVVNGEATGIITSSLSLNGWSLASNGVATIDVTIDDRKITTAYYGIRRDDVAAAFPDREGSLLSGFAALIPARALPRGRHKIGILVHDKADNVAPPLEFWIEVGEIAEEAGPWSVRHKIAQAEIDLRERLLDTVGWHPEFALAMTAGTGKDAVAAARVTLRSLAAQAYPNWRLAIVPAAGKTNLKTLRAELLEGFDDIADRVTFVAAGDRKQQLAAILGASGVEPALLGLLFAGDRLGVDALLEFASWSALNRGCDFIYCDERRLNVGTGQQDAFFKPDWSPDLLLSTNYIGRLWVASPSLFIQVEATPASQERNGEYDLALKITERAARIGHIPSVLIERGDIGAAAENDRGALESAISRRGIKGSVADGCAPGFFQLRRSHGVTGLVSIVMPTRAAGGLVKTCIETIRNNTDYRNFEIVCIENIPEKDQHWRDWLHENADEVVSTTEAFNWSRFNNLAAEHASGDYLIFLNDDIEIISSNWIDVLLSYAERPEVGIVGPLLLYPDHSIQHAGVFLTRNGTARHAFRYGPQDDPGYFGLALTDRDVIGVTGACLMTRRDTFDKVGKFDEAHTVINNDLDYCLRVWEAGFLNIYTAQTKLIHHELASRSEISDDYDSANFDVRWGDTFLRGDPYYHERLSKDRDDYSIDREPVRVVCPGHPLLAPSRIRNLLVTKLDHIGDAVTAIPAINRLRQSFPDARITVMGGRSTKPIWSLVPGIDEVIEFDFFHARSELGQKELTEEDLAALASRLAPYRFDLAIDLRKSPDTRNILKYTGAQYLAGYGHQTDFPWLDIAIEWEGDPRFQSKHAHVSDDLMRLVQAVELACSTNRIVIPPKKSKRPLPTFLPENFGERRIVAIHPAAGTPTRQWPAEYFSQLIDLLIEDHDVNIAIVGGPDETEIADQIIGNLRHPDRVVSCLGKMKLIETTEFLPECALFVGNNSGPSHIAAALGVPTVAVHSGVIASEEWGPYGPTGVAIRRDMSCAPCYIAKPEDCPRSLACLHRLGAGEVLKVCSGFLARS